MATLDCLIINMTNATLSRKVAETRQAIVDAMYQGKDTTELHQWCALYMAERDRRELIEQGKS